MRPSPVNRAVIARINRLKTLTIELKAGSAFRKYPAVKSGGPDDLVFQSVVTIGLPWINWQVLRRSFAMGLKKKGADVKDAQALMRHSKASAAMDVYMQFDSAIAAEGG